MTSTGINQGLNEDSKPSSKVLRPPGGGSNICFGGEPDPAPQKQSQRGHVAPPHQQQRTTKAPFGESEHVVKILPQTRGNYDPITGQKYDKTACHQPPPKPVPTSNYQPLPSAADGPGTMQSVGGKAQDVKTSSRVLNPPGGPTTKLW